MSIVFIQLYKTHNIIQDCDKDFISKIFLHVQPQHNETRGYYTGLKGNTESSSETQNSETKKFDDIKINVTSQKIS